jgi:hypothetical protein
MAELFLQHILVFDDSLAFLTFTVLIGFVLWGLA